ncbi:gastric triacylglycerol lipase-like [Ornithodoros turicata]|uniref:gastric triacylglycerol lipase-like n=1 Tax=Ornithodoros turicata TaxID=34597 RepID=UPI003138A25F
MASSLLQDHAVKWPLLVPPPQGIDDNGFCQVHERVTSQCPQMSFTTQDLVASLAGYRAIHCCRASHRRCCVSGQLQEYCRRTKVHEARKPEVISSAQREVIITQETFIGGKGYGFERHDVTTEDGYIIQIHRIPHGMKTCNETSKPVVFLMTGLLGDSTSYVLDFANQCVGFFLADNCYDVWIGNYRGTTLYGKRHVNEAFQNSREFWDFTFHQQGIYDLTAEIDYVLQETGRSKLFFVGISLGPAVLMVMMSERPDYNNKIMAATFLAPVYNLAHVTLPFLALTFPVGEEFLTGMYYAGVREFLPKNMPIIKLASFACQDPGSFICALLLEYAANMESKYVNRTRTPVYVCQYPAGTSTLHIIHLYQIGKRKKFQTFDCTYIRPSSTDCSPPRPYDISKTQVDVGVFYSDGDQFATPPDVESLMAELGDRIKFVRHIRDPEFGHFNFATAAFIHESYILKPMLEFLRRYS